MSIEITDVMVRAYVMAWRDQLFKDLEADRPSVRAGLAAVLALPEVRQAIHDDVRRETEAKLRALGATGYSLEFDQ